MAVQRTQSWRRLAAACLLVALATLLAISIARGDWHAGQAPVPFVWRDVAIVYLGCAVPLAWMIAWCVPRGLLIPMAVVVLGVSVTPFLDEFSWSFGTTVLVRSATGLGLALTLCLIGKAFFESKARRPVGWWPPIVALLILAMPLFYVAARSRHDARRLDELIDQHRIGEAQRLAVNLIKLDDDATVHGKSIHHLAAALATEARHLEEQVAIPLPAQSTAPQRLERARQLAMLGRTQAALEALAPLDAPEANLLRGLIHEACGDWENGRACYERARANLDHSSALTRAVAGVAYCQRKSGRYDEAEVAYLQLLELAPTADTHFLLAQFYEDAQQAQKAHFHARKAMTFAPSRYREPGERLINKMSVYQFGCFRVFDADQAHR